jgi:hypothetical protein
VNIKALALIDKATTINSHVHNSFLLISQTILCQRLRNSETDSSWQPVKLQHSMVSHILIDFFQIIWDLSNLLDRAIFIDNLVFQNTRPETHLSQIMEKMPVYYDKLTAA